MSKTNTNIRITQTKAAQQALRYHIVRMCMPDTNWPFERIVGSYFDVLREWYPLANYEILNDELHGAYSFWNTKLNSVN